jgi:hypothetical protein
VFDLVGLAVLRQGSSRVLSQTVSVTVRLKVVAIEPSKDVVASRFGRNDTPSGVVIDSGTETSRWVMVATSAGTSTATRRD